jgi:hypothetical protein
MEPGPFVFRRDGYLCGLRAAQDDTQELLDAVNRFTLRPLALEEIAVFTLDLCNNSVDRHFSRFPDEELERINALIVGRPLMERHDLRGSLPRGTFFRSRLHRDGTRASVRPDVYVLRTQDNEDFIRNIEGGVYRETSIGFAFRVPECSICAKHISACGHVPGREYAGVVCHFLMREVVDVLEGSVVSCGSQGTQFVAQTRLAAPEAPVFATQHGAPIFAANAAQKLWAAE